MKTLHWLRASLSAGSLLLAGVLHSGAPVRGQEASSPWMDDLEQAAQAAKGAGRPLLIYVYDSD